MQATERPLISRSAFLVYGAEFLSVVKMNSLLDNDSAVAEEMDSLMLHSDIGEEFEESTEAMLNSILRVDVVQLGQDDDDFADEYTTPYHTPIVPITPSKSLKKSRKCNCAALNFSSKDKRSKKCICDASSDATESPRRPTARKKRSKGLFECDLCDRSFVQLSLLEVHKKQHQESCVCDVCNETLPNQDALLEHQDRLSHKTVYRCNMCIATFATRRRLSTHKRVHVQERPFPCDFCNACFLRKSSLSAHLRAKPLGQPVLLQGDLTCEECKLAFISFCGKLKHCQALHPESVVFAENGQAKSIINVISQDTVNTTSKTQKTSTTSPSKTSKNLLKSGSQETGEKRNEVFDHHISREEQSHRDIEILFSVDVANLLNNPDDDLPEDANKNVEEEFDPFESVVLYSGEENDCGDGLDYEFVSQADAYAACNFLENPDSLHEIEEAEAEDRASRPLILKIFTTNWMEGSVD